MDFVESPAKRQRTGDLGAVDQSSDDSEHSILPLRSKASLTDNDFDYGLSDSAFETVATLPLQPKVNTDKSNSDRYTQPTQLLDRRQPSSTGISSPSRSIVQVAASSPTPVPVPVRRPGGILASAMAPAGTAFRVPNGVTRVPQRPLIIDLSDDDGPTYLGGSSDSDAARLGKNDIRTSSFTRGDGEKKDKIEESPQAKPGSARFQQIVANMVYNPSAKASSSSSSVFDARTRGNETTSRTVTSVTTSKRSADTLANAYGDVHQKRQRQNGPSRTQQVEDESDMDIEEILNHNMRQKVKRMNAILTSQTVRSCYTALKMKHGNFDDAVDYLIAKSEAKSKPPPTTHIDLMGSEDELGATPSINKTRPQPKVPVRSIQEKWGSTQLPHRSQVQKPARVAEPVKKGGRLVRGRKEAVSSGEDEEAPRKSAPIELSDSEDADSGLASSAENTNFEGRLLAFFNNSSAADISDTAGIPVEIASYFVSRRPFKSLNAVARVEASNDSKSSRRKTAPIGERVVEKCEEMMASYEAVDFLVKKCEDIGKPIAQEMEKWGIEVNGSKTGEFETISLRDSQSANHDSGIGTPNSEHDGRTETSKTAKESNLLLQPAIMNNQMQLKDYQLIGLTWLAMLFRMGLSCILADDMGLGKTCQVIAFLSHLFETGERGPHLIVVPASTIENWLNEFQMFCPSLVVEPYYAGEAERAQLRDKIELNREDINVVITTYATAKGKYDHPWLRKFRFCCTIYDEAHYLKNAESQVYTKLMHITSRFRLLLTGTPLQNNLKELISLLGFLMPSIFKDKKDELRSIFTHRGKALDTNHEALLSTQRIARARAMLTPFILRRKKYQVLKHIPTKTRRVEYCSMTESQMYLYTAEQEKARQIMAKRAAGENMGNESANILMKLRQAAIHPMLFRHIYDDAQLNVIAQACLKDPQWSQSNPDLILTELLEYSDWEIHELCARSNPLHKFALKQEAWMGSGKAQKLCELLVKFRTAGHRTLIFSQFVMVLTIIELLLQTLDVQFFRLDGGTPVPERQELINAFNAPNCEADVFLLSTKAGGAGINLATANKVIIFDSGFNPQDDIQAENRAHRIGQKREVEVVKLVSQGTVEEQIYAMGLTKLALDDKVAGEGHTKPDEKEETGRKIVEELLFDKLKQEPQDASSDILAAPSATGTGSLQQKEKPHAKSAKATLKTRRA